MLKATPHTNFMQENQRIVEKDAPLKKDDLIVSTAFWRDMPSADSPARIFCCHHFFLFNLFTATLDAANDTANIQSRK
jgi:hypothetical protein